MDGNRCMQKHLQEEKLEKQMEFDHGMIDVILPEKKVSVRSGTGWSA